MSLRNEPDWGFRGFSFSGLWGGRLRLGLGPIGLEALQILDGLALQSAGVIDAALEAGLGGGTEVEGLAGGGVGACRVQGVAAVSIYLTRCSHFLLPSI